MKALRKFILTATEFKTPLRISFGHSSAVRNETQTIIVTAKPPGSDVQEEKTGLGESTPREYVTGESLETVFYFIEKFKHDLESTIGSLSDLKKWAQIHKADIDKNPAAFAGIEGAIIDYLAKQQNQTVEKFLGMPQLKDRFHYSAVLGDSKPWKFWLQALLYWSLGFRDFKVKISGNLSRDRKKFAVLNMFKRISKIRLRADANNLWTDVDTCVRFVTELGSNFWAIEEPVGAGRTSQQKEISERLGAKIILDESLVTVEQLNAIKGFEEYFALNIRISKNGGILRSMEIAQAGQELEIPLIFGAHVGETSILTRYGVTVANAFREGLSAQEGCFGRFLIKHDAVSPSLNFGFGGVFRTHKLTGTNVKGSGLTADRDLIRDP